MEQIIERGLPVKSLDLYLLKFHRKIVKVKEFSFTEVRATDRRFIFVFVLFEKQGRARENEGGARTLPLLPWRSINPLRFLISYHTGSTDFEENTVEGL